MMDNFFWFKFTTDINTCDAIPSNKENYNFDRVDWCRKRVCSKCSMDVTRESRIKSGKLFERVIRIEL